MAVDPNVIRKIRRVIYSKDEPASTSVMWAKPDEDIFIYLVFDAGRWQEVGSSEGVIVPEVSVYLSAFTNDVRFITEGQLPQIFAPVAISGDYDDLINKPTIPAAQEQADWNQTDTSEPDYIKNKPNVPSLMTGTVTLVAGATSVSSQSGVTALYGYTALMNGEYVEVDSALSQGRLTFSIRTAQSYDIVIAYSFI